MLTKSHILSQWLVIQQNRWNTVVRATFKYDEPMLKMSHSLPCIVCILFPCVFAADRGSECGASWSSGQLVWSRHQERSARLEDCWSRRDSWHRTQLCGEWIRCSAPHCLFSLVCLKTGFLQVRENWKRSGNLIDHGTHTHTHRLMALCQTFFINFFHVLWSIASSLLIREKSGIAHCFLDMWQQLNEYLIFCQTLNSMWNVHGKKIKSVGTKSFEMIKSACRGKLCWCCKLLCAFSTEMCSGSGIDQGMLYDWLKLLCWDVHMHANHIICFHLAIQPFHVPLV